MQADKNMDLVHRFIRLPLAQRKLFFQKLQSKGMSLSQLPIPPSHSDFAELPLSYAQQRQWFIWKMEPDSPAYNIHVALRLRGALNIEALSASFETLIARHETLRTTFRQVDGQAIQVIQADASFTLNLEAPPSGRSCIDDDSVQGLVEAEARVPFDLETGPLLRVKLLPLAEDDHVLVLTLHHIVADGWSIPIMVDELVRLYEGYSTGLKVVLPELPIQYADYAIWQRSWMEAGEQERQLEYWKAQLSGEQKVLALPTDRSRPAVQRHAGARVLVDIGAALTTSLRQLAQEQGATLFMLLLASFQALLHRYSGQDDIRIGVPLANRNRAETERLIGFFVNTQVLKAEFGPHTTFSELLQQVRQAVLDAQLHQDLPFEQLVEALQPERSLSYSPLFQVMFNHQTQAKGGDRALPGLTLEALSWESHTTHFDLVLNTFEGDDGLSASLFYATDLFERSTIERLVGHWRNLLEAVCVRPEQRVAALPMLSELESRSILETWDQSRAGFPASRHVHRLIEEMAEVRPDALAVICDDRQLTYGQLDARANRLAHKLIELGVGPEIRVAVAMSRSLDIMVAFLSVLKAGGAYVPLDVTYPADRLLYMMEDCSAALVLSQHDVLTHLPLPEGLPSLAVDRENDWCGYPESSPQVVLAQENLAYVIYTSGSTGQPKGVMVSHGPLAAHCLAAGDRYEMSTEDCELQFMSLAFDGAHERWLTALIHGARLLVRGDELWTPEQTYQLMHHHAVTVTALPPIYLQQLAEHAEYAGDPPPVRIYCFGGDAVPQASYELAWRTLRPQHIFNGYGPTETVVTPLLWKAEKGEDCGAAYAPIGTLLGNRRSYVLDADLNLLPVGLAGELFLGGEGVARGYLERPGLTAERFVPDPFVGDGGRVYRSGDLVRARPDGLVDYLGRVDHQVKIRGFRIELGEIEERLLALDAVREAVVLVRDMANGRQLVGYVVPTDTEVAEDLEACAMLREALRARLKDSLPDYMVPTHLLFLACLPLTPNGKLDRKALPLPDASQSRRVHVAPRTELERRIAVIWRDVLKVEEVGLSDNFFELGGDSIISLQVVSRARQVGIQFSPRDLFHHQTVQGVAGVARLAASMSIDQGAVLGKTPLTPIQQWFFEEDIPARHHWNQSVLLKPCASLDPERLRATLQALVEHHDALRMRFALYEGIWQAEFQSPGSVEPLWIRHLSDPTELERVVNEAQRSLSLEDGELLRAVLMALPDGSQRLLLVIHHLVVDGVSWRVLLEDLQHAYGQVSTGGQIRMPAKTSSFKEWAERLQAHAASAIFAQELGFWQEQLYGAPDELPCDRPGGGLQQKHAAFANSCLNRDWTRRLLQEAPAAYRTRINDLLLTALARVICRWTGQPSMLIRLEGHGREGLFEDIDLTRTVAWFTSVYPLRLVPKEELAGSIKAVKEQLRAVPNNGIGYGLLRYLGPPEARQALKQLPQGEIVFNYLGQFDNSFDVEDGLLVPASEGSGAPQSAEAPLGAMLSLNGQVYEGELNIGWSFSREVFDEQTIQRLAEEYAEELKVLIEHCCQDDGGVTPSDFPLANLSQAQLDRLPIAAQEIEDIYPLSPMQQGMLFHTLYERKSGDYVNQMRVDVVGLEVERFRQAWQEAVDSHEVLRASFISDLEQPQQVIRRHMRIPFAVLDWRGTTGLEDALAAWAQGDRQKGFDLRNEPLLRLTVIRTDEHRYHLIYTNHHILMDGWSGSLLLGEVLQRYAGRVATPVTGRYRDYIAWLKRQDPSASEVFWRKQLSGFEEPTRLTRSVHGDVGEAAGCGDYHQHFDQEQTLRLEAFARAHRLTLNTLVQAAWLLLLQRYTGQQTVAFGATVAGRPVELAGVEEQVGLFINTLPVIGTPCPEQVVSEWLTQLQERNLALREQEHTPLYDIQRWAGLGGEALFDTILVFENYPVSEALQQGAPDGLRFGRVDSLEQTHYPLTLAVSMGGDSLTVHYGYDLRHFTARMVGRLAEHFGNLLHGLATDTDGLAHVGELAILDENEYRQIVHEWNCTETNHPSDQCIHRLIEAQVERRPEATALVFGEHSLSYRELNQRANRLAHRLRELGVGPDVLVGIAVERSLEMVVGLLGILKAGGAYVPLDPEYPRERLAYMIEDSGIGLLLTQSHLHGQLPLPEDIRSLDLEGGSNWLKGYSEANLESDSHPENLAYVIYTSGSTGKPKGAGNTHEALVNRLCWMQKAYELDAADTVLQKTPFSFDVSVWEFFWPLMTGARLVIAHPGEHRDPERLVEVINRHGVTTLHFVPSMLQTFVSNGRAESCRSIRRLICSGEALSVELVRKTQERLPDTTLFNLYGPTEAAIDVTHWTCGDEEGSGVPIGRPIDNLKTHILDEGLLPAIQGGGGELYLGGIGLARGYHNRPALTAERFVPDPFNGGEQGGGRFYRTGDLARYRDDGVIEYLGRLDHQVKLRGLRIELGEIEAKLQEYPEVREVVVIDIDGPAGKQLVAYLVASDLAQTADPDGQNALRGILRDHLKATLPDYMVPAYLLFLDSLPLTPNGKLDRKALPKPDAAQQRQAYVAPQSELQVQIASIWAEVLKVDQVGLGDNFFELGGHSLLATQVVVRIRGRLGIDTELRELFESENLADFCHSVTRATHTALPQDELAKSLEALKRLTTEEIDELIS